MYTIGLMNTADIERISEHAATTGSPAAQIVAGILEPRSYADLRLILGTYFHSFFYGRYNLLPYQLGTTIDGDPKLRELSAPLRDFDRQFFTTQINDFMSSDPLTLEAATLSGLIATDISQRDRTREKPPSYPTLHARAISRLERTFGAGLTRTGINLPPSRVIVTDDPVIQDAQRVRATYPREFARAEIFGDETKEDDTTIVGRVESYVQDLRVVGEDTVKAALTQYEEKLGGFSLGIGVFPNGDRTEKYAGTPVTLEDYGVLLHRIGNFYLTRTVDGQPMRFHLESRPRSFKTVMEFGAIKKRSCCIQPPSSLKLS